MQHTLKRGLGLEAHSGGTPWRWLHLSLITPSRHSAGLRPRRAAARRAGGPSEETGWFYVALV